MTKEITVADLKEHLEERLEEVRNGVTLRVLDGGRAVMNLTPVEAPRAERKERLGDLRFPPLDPPIEVDAVQVLLELRGDR